MQIEISANKRVLQGKGASRRLRGSGKVPGIIYGGETQAQSIELDHNNLYHKLKLEAFHASILSLDLDGKKEQVLLRDLQMHPFRLQIQHIDFQRVDQNKKIHMKVPLHFINADIAPGVKVSGGIVSHILSELEISCLPKDLPEFIEVDLSTMQAGGSLHVSDLKLPAGVVATHAKENPTIATAAIPRGAKGDDTAAAAPAEEAKK